MVVLAELSTEIRAGLSEVQRVRQIPQKVVATFRQVVVGTIYSERQQAVWAE